jgi:acid stress chaperone HdeB
MKRFIRILPALSLATLVGPAHSQVTLDVSKITCDQFLLYRVADPRDIALWLNGYHNAQTKNTVLDPQKLKDHFDKLKDYCRINRELSVMDAAQKVIEMSK